MKKIYAEEGLLALYRGYNAYILAVTHNNHLLRLDPTLDECVAISHRFHANEDAYARRSTFERQAATAN
jgi:hypothetical protein